MISRRWVTVPLFYLLSFTNYLNTMHRIHMLKVKDEDLWQEDLINLFCKGAFTVFRFCFYKRYSCGIFLRTCSKISKQRNVWISFVASDILLLLRFVVLIVFFRISNRSFLCIFCLLIVVFKRFFLFFNGSFLYKVQFSFKEVMEWPHISKYFLGVVL